ncbi:MAG: type II toxin-antitoxin system Phd/YefM family antitoxin [Acidimicrobiales bacterium]
MISKVVMASTFKQQCLALLDEVAAERVTVVVTKRGKPIARLMPLEDDPPISLMGSVTLLHDDDEAYFSTGETWEAEAEP